MAAQRIDIGFVGGQVLTVRLDEGALQDLRKALQRDPGWYDIEAEDGQVAIDRDKVAYVKLDSGEHRVGFITEG
jgi:hypothetical protein